MSKNFNNYGSKEIILQQVEEAEIEEAKEYYKNKGYTFEDIHDSFPCEDGSNILTLKFSKEKFLKCSFKEGFKI